MVSPTPGLGVVAVNLWYDVGSRHEEPHRQGFAHLFEHLMFQGSRHVKSGDHFALLQGHGASLNATTSFDRTNYFESMPAGALDLGLWLEADRMAYLDDVLTQENFRNQVDVLTEANPGTDELWLTDEHGRPHVCELLLELYDTGRDSDDR